MNVLKTISSSLNARNLGVALFAVTGGFKTYQDYKSASEDKKKYVLKRDLTILAGTAVGLTTYHYTQKAIVKSKMYNSVKTIINNKLENFVKSDFGKKIFKSKNRKAKSVTAKVIKDSLETIKDCTSNILMVSSGFLGAIGTRSAIKKIHKHNKNNKKEKVTLLNTENSKKNTIMSKNHGRVSNFEVFANNIRNNSYNFVNQETQKNLFSNLVTMPEMKLFSNSMVGLQSFEVMQEKSFTNQLRKATTNIITGTLIPVFYLSLATNLTKGLKNNILRFPFVFVSMAAATMYTNKKIGPKLEKINS